MSDFQIPFRFDSVTVRDEQWTLDQFPPNEDLLSKPPSAEFIQNIAGHGVITPVHVALLTDRNYEVFVVAGCKRIKAARACDLTDPIPVRIKDMTLIEAMSARSIENNQRTGNALADIHSLALLLQHDPKMSTKTLARLTGMTQGRVKSLLPQARLPRLLLDAVEEGTTSEEVIRKLSTMPDEYVASACQTFAENKAKYVKDKAQGKKLQKVPILLSGHDLVVLQQVRKDNAVSNLSIFAQAQQAQQMPAFDLSAFGVDAAPEPEGYMVIYKQNGDVCIHNYQMYTLEDAQYLFDALKDNGTLEDLHISKVERL